MPTRHTRKLALASALCSAALIPMASAQTADARRAMEQCVDRVLSRLARAKAPEAQAGPAVLAQCDGPLRATLASAINTGDAFICSIDSCLGIARDRAAEEARLAYRERLTRSAAGKGRH